MLMMVIRRSDDGIDSWVSFYGVYNNPSLAAIRMKEVVKEDGNSDICKLITDREGFCSYESEHVQYSIERVEVNEGVSIF